MSDGERKICMSIEILEDLLEWENDRKSHVEEPDEMSCSLTVGVRLPSRMRTSVSDQNSQR